MNAKKGSKSARQIIEEYKKKKGSRFNTIEKSRANKPSWYQGRVKELSDFSVRWNPNRLLWIRRVLNKHKISRTTAVTDALTSYCEGLEGRIYTGDEEE